MLEILALSISIISLFGIIIIVFQKLPALLEIPEIPAKRFSRKNFLDKTKNKIPFKRFSLEIFLQKILSSIRILTLKTDSKTSIWLTKLRQRARRKEKIAEKDNYWQEIKKSTKDDN